VTINFSWRYATALTFPRLSAIYEPNDGLGRRFERMDASKRTRVEFHFRMCNRIRIPAAGDRFEGNGISAALHCDTLVQRVLSLAQVQNVSAIK
jgi:hypothetical protein